MIHRMQCSYVFEVHSGLLNNKSAANLLSLQVKGLF